MFNLCFNLTIFNQWWVDTRALMFHLSTNYMLGSLKVEAKQEVSLKHYAT